MIREKIKAFGELNTAGKLSAVSFAVFCMVAADCALTGGGHWLKAGPVSLRMLLCALAAAAAVPSVLRSARGWIKDPMLVSLLLFAVYAAVCGVVGYAKGNPAGLLLSDLKGFAWLILVPVAAAVVNSPQRLRALMRCLAAAAAVQAVMILVFNAVFVTQAGAYDLFYRYWMQIQLATVDQISPTTYRFFFNSAPYLVVGILCMLWFQWRARRFSFFYAAGTGVCLMALMLTFTRSLYGAAAVSLASALILGVICCGHKWKRLALHIAAAVAVLAALAVFQQLALGCNSVQFALARTFNMPVADGGGEAAPEDMPAQPQTEDAPDAAGAAQAPPNQLNQNFYLEDTQKSDELRERTLRELHGMIAQSPVFGNGLGAAIQSREGGLVEYFYQDLLNKTGVAGLLLYYFPVAFMAFTLARRWKRLDGEGNLLRIAWLCGIGVFLIATYFNPYMNSSLGICCYSIALACFRLKPAPAEAGKALPAGQ